MDETEEIGSVIGKVTAIDADDSSTPDGVFSYSLVGSFPFNLDSSSGLRYIISTSHWYSHIPLFAKSNTSGKIGIRSTSQVQLF